MERHFRGTQQPAGDASSIHTTQVAITVTAGAVLSSACQQQTPYRINIHLQARLEFASAVLWTTNTHTPALVISYKFCVRVVLVVFVCKNVMKKGTKYFLMVSLMSLSLIFWKGVSFAPLSLFPSREAATSPSLTLPHHTCRRPTDPSHPRTQPWPRKRVRGQPPNRSCLPSPRSATAVCCIHTNWTEAVHFSLGFLWCATAQIEGLVCVLPCSRARCSPPTHPPCCRTDVRTGHSASCGIGWGGARRFLQAAHCHHRCVCLWSSPRLACAKECVCVARATNPFLSNPPTRITHTHPRPRGCKSLCCAALGVLHAHRSRRSPLQRSLSTNDDSHRVPSHSFTESDL
jgi:hypothetical protein